MRIRTKQADNAGGFDQVRFSRLEVVETSLSRCQRILRPAFEQGYAVSGILRAWHLGSGAMDSRPWAENYATSLLADNPRRLAHSRAVATSASELADVLLDDPDERSVLVAAAWLHDIGYAPMLAKTGAHHLDGALHLEQLDKHRLACLVAHHGSGAAATVLRGFSHEFGQFPRESSLAADILTYCDLSCGPDGTRLALDGRLREIRVRYGDDHVVVRGLEADDDAIRSAFSRVGLRLGEVEPDAATQAITGSG